MRSTKRNIRELGVIGVVLALVLGVVVAAVQAEGERTIRPDTHDGGAWLINGSEGAVGHINRSSREITGAISLADQGDRIDTEQSGNFVVVVNRSKQTLKIVDARTFQDIRTIGTPPELSLRFRGDDVIAWTEAPLRVWRTSVAQLGETNTLDEIDPVISSTTGDRGQVVVTRFGRVIAVELATALLHRLDPTESSATVITVNDMGADIVDVTAHGDDTVLLTRTGSVFVVAADGTEVGAPASFGNAVILGQPTLPGDPVTAVTREGDILLFDLDSDDPLPRTSGRVNGARPLAPLFHRGCVYVVTRQPAELTKVCNGEAEPAVPLDGAGNELRLRLINDWVWINDLDAGILWVVNDTTPLDRIDDWGAALSDRSGEDEDDESDNEGDGRIEERENPDADDTDIQRADEIDEDKSNDLPIANDDMATTRVDLPVIVDVVQNDIDPDGDVLLVTALSDAPSGGLLATTATSQSVQFSPPAGATGTFRFDYTISDGRGGTDSATVTVDVIDPAASLNRAPIAVTDAVTARAGSSAALNVLANDRDPDGDSLVLRSVEADDGTVKFDPSGQVTYIPDPGSVEGIATLGYTIADTYGATASGSIRVAIRLRAANNPPDARNDSAVIPIGNPLTMNVLFNDTDPDGNAITVGAEPVRISPDETDAELQLSSDGQLFFIATTAGEYLYEYTITDAEKTDVAQIRIAVTEAAENRPPTAVRDDVTVPRGGSTTVFVLTNDYDPDGDVIAIDTFEQTEHLSIESFRGAGLLVNVAPEAPEQMSFRYTITDGLNEPVGGVVVVAVAESAGANQPPIATPDVLEIRPGTTAVGTVVNNDFDPEGAPLRIVNVSSTPDAELRISATEQEILVTLPETAESGFTFAYDIVDDAGNLAGTTVDVRIVPDGQTNRPPTARSDSARTAEERPVTIPVLNNDSDPDGDIIRLESISAQPTAGTAEIVDGAVVYTPDPGFAGTDRFRYTIADPFDGRAIGEVLIGVIPDTIENRPPSARDDRYVVVAGSDQVLLDVTANDYDPDGDPLTIIQNSGGGAIATSNNAQGLLFTPPAGIERASVELTVSYTIDDGRGATSDAQVAIEVVQVTQPEPPIASDDVGGPVRPGDTIEIDVTLNDVDPDGKREDLTVQSDDGAGTPGSTPGSLVFVAGELTSTHRYTITDVDGQSSTAIVTIIVFENVAPTVAALETSTGYETPLALSLGGQATDIDDDALFFVCCSDSRGGIANITDSGEGVLEVLFTPETGFSGVGGFSYTADDQKGHVVAGSVTIVVTPKENGAPTADDATIAVEAGTSSTISLASITDDEDFPTGDVLSFELTENTLSNAVLAGDTITVTSAIDEGNTSGTIGYTVTDREGLTASATVSVEITESTIDPPIATADSATTTQTQPVTLSLFDNDLDRIGDGLRLVSVGATIPNGIVESDEATGVITFTPEPDFFGTHQLTYVIEDARRLESGRATGSITIDVTGFPGAPPTPEAVADDTTATVTWEQPEPNGGAIDEFQIESDTGYEETLAVTSGTTVTGLTNTVPIRFRVRAHNVAGYGEWSNWSEPVIPDTQPGRPGAPTVEFRDQALFVTWSRPTNTGTPITNYVLEIGGGASDTRTLFDTTSFEWDGLTNGVEYNFKVTAVNSAGPSDESPWSTSEHPLREPDAPPAPIVTRGDRRLDLAWDAANNNGDDIINYEIEMRSQSGNIVPIPSGRTHPWSNLPNGTEQEFRVRANNRDTDPGAWSSWSVPIQPCGAPIPVGTPTAVRGDTQAAVTWTLPETNGCDLTGLRLESTDGSVGIDLGPGVTSRTVGTLTNGTSYQFRIRGTNVFGTGSFSGNSNAVIPAGPPCRITNLSLSATALNEIRYNFTAPCDNGAPITGYEIRVNSGGAEAATLTDSSPPSIAGVRSGVAPNSLYSIEVHACNDVGCGAWSNGPTITTVGPPSTPPGYSVANGTTAITWSWGPVVSNGPGLRYDTVWYDSQGSPVVTNRGNVTSHSWATAPYQNITNQVRACNDFGCSAWSAQRTGQVQPAFFWEVGRNGTQLRGSARGLGPNVTWNYQCFYENFSGDGFVLGQSGTITSDANGERIWTYLCNFSISGRLIGADLWPIGGTVRNQSNLITWP